MGENDIGRLRSTVHRPLDEKLQEALRQATTGAGATGNAAIINRMLDAALLLNTMERGPGVSAAPSDGPRDAGEFWWKGTRYEIPPTPWKLLAFVWQQENRRASFADVAEQVWGDDTKHRRNIDRHLSTINNALMATGISLHAKNETVSIDLP